MDGWDNEYREFSEKFFEFEQAHDVFSVTCNGVPVWERIRLPCFRRLMTELGVYNQAHPEVERDNLLNYVKGGYKWARGLVQKNPFFASEADFLFIGSSRRKPRDDGYQWDLFCDPILDALDLDYVYTEPPYQFSHRTPAKTENIRYLDAITYTSLIQRKLGLASYEFTAGEKAALSELEADMEAIFGVSVDIQELVRDTLSERKSRKWLYERLLDRIRPKIAVIVAGAFKKTFIEVCQERDIPVVELQHGSGHHDHLGYSFPDGTSVSAFPDHLFVFGQFWKDTVDYPLPDENVHPVGYPYLEAEAEAYADSETRQQIVFSSQGTIGEQLSKAAVEFDDLDTGYDVVYNLHPGEYDRWREEYPWLVDSSIEVIDDDTPPMYQVLSESEVHVGVYSTVVYEGFAFGLDTYLLEAPGVDRMRHLLNRGLATKVSSAEELARHISDSEAEAPVDTDYFFEPNAIDKVSAVFDAILENDQ